MATNNSNNLPNIGSYTLTGSVNLIGSTNPTYAIPKFGQVSPGSNPASGVIAENITATGSAVSMTTATSKSIANITLTAGDWDLYTSIYLTGAGGSSLLKAGASSVNNTLPNDEFCSIAATSGADIQTITFVPPVIQVNITGNQIWYLVAQSTSASGSLTGTGTIHGIRRR